jgi:D-serine deaminase-like pyridoxal phosphate-dependent protein
MLVLVEFARDDRRTASSSDARLGPGRGTHAPERGPAAGPHLGPLGVEIRPHLKTVKSVEAPRRVLKDGTGPATVSTLREAGVFSAAGVKDIVYAVGISPDKLPRVLSLRSTGCDLTVVLDSIVQAEAVATASRVSGDRIAVLVEIDFDGHRSGLAADDPKLVEIGQIVAEHATLRGVITHAGESYGAVGAEAQAGFAEKERVAAVGGAQALRFAGLPCPVVSVGSTPTAHCARNLEGVTEVRAGVYVFFDLVMAGIEVCTQDDIALSVLTTVIGHQKERGWIIVDVGWMAMSRDRGTANQAVDQGYGVVCDIHRRPLKDLIIVSANQEHGVVAVRSGSATPFRICRSAPGSVSSRTTLVRPPRSSTAITWFLRNIPTIWPIGRASAAGEVKGDVVHLGRGIRRSCVSRNGLRSGTGGAGGRV